MNAPLRRSGAAGRREVAFQGGEICPVGFDHEEDCASVLWLDLRWFSDANQRTAGTH